MSAPQKETPDRDSESSAGTEARSAAQLASKWEQWKRVQVLTNQHGNILAYFLPSTRSDLLQIDEIGLLDPATCPPLLHACAANALDANHTRMQFVLPDCHPFTDFLRRSALQCQHDQYYDANGMMAFQRLSPGPSWVA